MLRSEVSGRELVGQGHESQGHMILYEEKLTAASSNAQRSPLFPSMLRRVCSKLRESMLIGQLASGARYSFQISCTVLATSFECTCRRSSYSGRTEMNERRKSRYLIHRSVDWMYCRLKGLKMYLNCVPEFEIFGGKFLFQKLEELFFSGGITK